MSYVSIDKREAMIKKLIVVLSNKVAEPPETIENNARNFEQKILNEHKTEIDYMNALNNKIKSLEGLNLAPGGVAPPGPHPNGSRPPSGVGPHPVPTPLATHTKSAGFGPGAPVNRKSKPNSVIRNPVKASTRLPGPVPTLPSTPTPSPSLPISVPSLSRPVAPPPSNTQPEPSQVDSEHQRLKNQLIDDFTKISKYLPPNIVQLFHSSMSDEKSDISKLRNWESNIKKFQSKIEIAIKILSEELEREDLELSNFKELHAQVLQSRRGSRDIQQKFKQITRSGELYWWESTSIKQASNVSIEVEKKLIYSKNIRLKRDRSNENINRIVKRQKPVPDPTIDEIINNIKNEIFKYTETNPFLDKGFEEDQQTIIIKENESKGRFLRISFNVDLDDSSLWNEFLPIDPIIPFLRPVIPNFTLHQSIHSKAFEEYITKAIQNIASKPENQSNILYLLKTSEKFLIANSEAEHLVQ